MKLDSERVACAFRLRREVETQIAEIDDRAASKLFIGFRGQALHLLVKWLAVSFHIFCANIAHIDNGGRSCLPPLVRCQ